MISLSPHQCLPSSHRAVCLSFSGHGQRQLLIIVIMRICAGSFTVCMLLVGCVMPDPPCTWDIHHAAVLHQVRPGGLAAFAVDVPASKGQAEEEVLVVMVELQRGRKPAPEEVDELIALVRRTVR